jgi:serine protease Do
MKKGYYIMLVLGLVSSLSGCRKGPGRSGGSRRTNQLTQTTGGTTLTNGEESAKPPRKTTEEASGTQLSGKEIFKRYNSAVFMIYTSDGTHGYQGSGFFINGKGLAVSNYHVFQGTTKGRESIKLSNGDKTYYRVKRVIKSSEEEDFILFEVDCNNTQFIPIAKSKPEVGDKVFAIGSPRGLENTFSSGEVSAWRQDYQMQISVPIDHGSSGGALINEYGEVVGITSGTLDKRSNANLNYAWSIEAVKPYIHN